MTGRREERKTNGERIAEERLRSEREMALGPQPAVPPGMEQAIREQAAQTHIDADLGLRPLQSDPSVHVAPHPFERRGWRWWVCHHCFAPRSLHPRTTWGRARPLGENQYLSASAPHFKEGW